jgi:antitoxin HicB
MLYAVKLTPASNGTLIAEVPDLPGVMTVGRDRADALEQARDALLTGIAYLLGRGEPVPAPSRVRRGEPAVSLPAGVAAKIAIHEAMRAQGVTQSALAERLACDPRQVRRLLDLDHASTLAQLEAALAALGKRMVVEIQAAA